MHESGMMSPGFPALFNPSIAEGTEFMADEFEQRKTDISRPGTKSPEAIDAGIEEERNAWD